MTNKIQPVEEPLLTFKEVTLGYPGIIALDRVSFTVKRGEFVGIIGPNGAGKSTLLKGILGLLPVVDGDIRIFGMDGRRKELYRKKIGYVPQKNKSEIQFPALVKEVVMMGLYSQIGWWRRPKPFDWEKVVQSLDVVGLGDLKERPFRDLSGGQQQRVIIARALVHNPELLILDEPTAAVDISAQFAILEILERLNREDGKTILMVSHDLNEIIHFCDKILLLSDNAQYFGKPNEILTKENLVLVYGERVFVYEHNGHPHVLVGDFDH